MNRNKKVVQLIILAAVAIVGLFTIVSSLSSDKKVPGEGDKAVSFSMLGLDGKVHSLSEYDGKIRIVNFWGTFCPPCKREMPAIERQYDKWKASGVEVIGINLAESQVTVQSFVDENHLTFPILFDEKLEIRKKYGVINYPTTFFIDSKGTILLKKEGEMDESFIEHTLANMISK